MRKFNHRLGVIKWLGVFSVISACVDPIDFDIPVAESQIVVEGMISDSPGPYTVKVSKAFDLNNNPATITPFTDAKIKLLDDQGNVEDLPETSPGIYKSGGVIQGMVGHEYHIRIETPEGKIFESEPDRIYPVGEVQNIRYEFQDGTQKQPSGEVQPDYFSIYLDSYAGPGDDHYVRWRYTGTFRVVTNPELHQIFLQVSSYKDPLPCSGYVVLPMLGGGKLEQVSECTCCTCWVNQFENEPLLSDGQFVTNNQYKNVKIAEVPITTATFFDKFLVEVEQMSLSRKSFEFFRLIRAQKDGASSLFQPPSGEIRGNIKPINSSDPVVGIFWATSIKKKSIFIHKSDVPYKLAPSDFVPDACTNYYSNSSTTKPDSWNE